MPLQIVTVGNVVNLLYSGSGIANHMDFEKGPVNARILKSDDWKSYRHFRKNCCRDTSPMKGLNMHTQPAVQADLPRQKGNEVKCGDLIDRRKCQLYKRRSKMH